MTLLRNCLILIALLVVAFTAAQGQATPTATSAGVFQLGGGISAAKPDYGELTIKGITIYSTFDFKTHWGIEADVHLIDMSTPENNGEKSYLIGPRYVRHYGRMNPYAKILIGRGVFEFKSQNAAVAANMYAAGAGLDIHAWRNVNVRVIDFEYQNWPGFLDHGLTPLVATAGVAYSFH